MNKRIANAVAALAGLTMAVLTTGVAVATNQGHTPPPCPPSHTLPCLPPDMPMCGEGPPEDACWLPPNEQAQTLPATPSAVLGSSTANVDALVATRVVYDLPARPLKDTFRAVALLAYQRQYDPKFLMKDVKQCGVYALDMVDQARHMGPYAELLKLNRAWKAVHPKSKGVPAGWIDDAAVLLHIRVDSTPHIGAIGIYEANTNGAGANGHAFQVSNIDTIHRRVRIQEYNWTRPNAWDTRVVPYGVRNLKFVHFTLTGA